MIDRTINGENERLKMNDVIINKVKYKFVKIERKKANEFS